MNTVLVFVLSLWRASASRPQVASGIRRGVQCFSLETVHKGNVNEKLRQHGRLLYRENQKIVVADIESMTSTSRPHTHHQLYKLASVAIACPIYTRRMLERFKRERLRTQSMHLAMAIYNVFEFNSLRSIRRDASEVSQSTQA